MTTVIRKPIRRKRTIHVVIFQREGQRLSVALSALDVEDACEKVKLHFGADEIIEITQQETHP